MINYTVPSGGISSGDLVKIGGMVGVAVNGGVENDVVAVNLCGVYEVPKASGAITKGARLYYDAAEGELTTTAAGNTFAGFAWQAQQSGDATCLVRLWNGDESGSTLSQAANVEELGATANLTALSPTAASITDTDGTYNNAAEPTGAEVDATVDALRDKVETALDLKADNADVETLRGEVEARLDDVEAKVDELIAALVASGLMDAP